MALSCQTTAQPHPPLHPHSISLQANADDDTPFRGCPSILGGIKRPSRPFNSLHKSRQPCSSFHLHLWSPHWLYYLSHPFIYDFYDPQRHYTSPGLCSVHLTSHPAILLLHTSHTAPWHNPCTPFPVTLLRLTSFLSHSLYTTHTSTRQLVAHPASNANFHSFHHLLSNPSCHCHFLFHFWPWISKYVYAYLWPALTPETYALCSNFHSVGLYRNVRIIDLNLSVGITNPRRLNLIFIPSVTVKHFILYKFTLIFIYIFYK